jgi:hypothetical protein
MVALILALLMHRVVLMVNVMDYLQALLQWIYVKNLEEDMRINHAMREIVV